MPSTDHHQPRRARLAALTIGLALILTVSLASAQGSVYENTQFGFRMTLPGAWDVLEEVIADGTVSATATAPSGDELYVIALQPLDASEQARYAAASLEEIMFEVWEGFQPEVPGAQSQGYGEGTIAGTRAAVLDYLGQGLAGSLAVIDGQATLIVIAYVVAEARRAEAEPLFYAALETVELAGAGAGVAPPPPETEPTATDPERPADGAVNPLSPPPAADEPGAAPVNPLAPQAGADAPTNPLAARPPFAGSFAGDGLELALEFAGGNTYTGQLAIGGESYPVNANALDASTLEGTFTVGATPFPFTATLDGDALELVSEGARHQLAR